jgi:hypothetical protein
MLKSVAGGKHHLLPETKKNIATVSLKRTELQAGYHDFATTLTTIITAFIDIRYRRAEQTISS